MRDDDDEGQWACFHWGDARMIRYKGFEDLVNSMSSSMPDRPALQTCTAAGDVRTLSWSELAESVNERAHALTKTGHACEAVLADGTPECVIEVFAAVQAGLQVALIDPLVPNRVMEQLLHAVDADCVWASDEGRRTALEELVTPGATPAFGAHGVLFFTSGTTSASKAVVLTDGSLMASAFNGSSLMPLSRDDTLLCLLPLSHVFGFVCGLLWGLSCGATVSLGRGPRHYVDDLCLFEPTAISVVPKLLEYLVAHDALNANLKLVLVGAADCPDELLDEVRRRGVRASLGYGLTETSSGIALSVGDDFHAMTVCPDDEVMIADNGEIVVHAPTCQMQGYYRDAEKTAEAVKDGMLHTGDQGYLDDAGLLHVTGRIKDVVALPGGTKVFLPDYEAAVSLALAERDVAAMLLDGKMTLVCGQLTRNRTESQVMDELGPSMLGFPPSSRIGRVVFLGHALPRTAAGDVERWKIQEEMEHGNC